MPCNNNKKTRNIHVLPESIKLGWFSDLFFRPRYDIKKLYMFSAYVRLNHKSAKSVCTDCTISLTEVVVYAYVRVCM